MYFGLFFASNATFAQFLYLPIEKNSIKIYEKIKSLYFSSIHHVVLL